MKGQIINDGLISGFDGNYYRYGHKLGFSSGNVVEFEIDGGSAFNINLVDEKLEKVPEKEKLFDKFNASEILDKAKNSSLDDIKSGIKNIKKPNFNLRDRLKQKKDNENSLENDNEEFDDEKNENNNFVFSFDMANKIEKRKEQSNLKFADYSQEDDENDENNSKLEEKSNPEIKKQENIKISIKDKLFSKKPTIENFEDFDDDQKSIKIAKILAISAVIVPFVTVFIMGFLGLIDMQAIAQKDPTYKMPLSSACIVIAVTLWAIIATYIAFKKVADLGQSSTLHRNYIKMIVCPIVLVVMLAVFSTILLGYIRAQNGENLALALAGIGVLFLLFVLYIVNLQIKILYELARLTDVELFKVHAILLVISLVLQIVFQGLVFLGGLIFELQGIFINVMPIIVLAEIGVQILGLVSFVIYIIAWFKVKSVHNSFYRRR